MSQSSDYPLNAALGLRRWRTTINAILALQPNRWRAVRISLPAGAVLPWVEIVLHRPTAQNPKPQYWLRCSSDNDEDIGEYDVTDYWIAGTMKDPMEWHRFLGADLGLQTWPYLLTWLDGVTTVLDRSSDVVEASAYNASRNRVHVLHTALEFAFSTDIK